MLESRGCCYNSSSPPYDVPQCKVRTRVRAKDTVTARRDSDVTYRASAMSVLRANYSKLQSASTTETIRSYRVRLKQLRVFQ